MRQSSISALTMLLILFSNPSPLLSKTTVINSMLRLTMLFPARLRKAQWCSLKMTIKFCLLKKDKRLPLSAKWRNRHASRAPVLPLSIPRSLITLMMSLLSSAQMLHMRRATINPLPAKRIKTESRMLSLFRKLLQLQR